MSTEFSSWLSTMAKALGYATDASVANALEISPSTILRWRQGSKPRVEHLARVSRVLGVRLEPLLILAGHVSPDAFGVRGEVPEVPTVITEPVLAIEQAPVSKESKRALLVFWERRQVEERERLDMLIKVLAMIAKPDSRAAELCRLSLSDLPEHIAGLIETCRVKGQM